MTKKIPEFKNEKAEQAFWAKNNSMKYLDWNKGKTITFTNLKPTTRIISIRLPEYLIAELKTLANKRDIPYQSLLKIILEKGVSRELFKHY